jgi:hypothetical protein
MQDRIQELLQHSAASHSVYLLFACESGSRAWGFPSMDSDYDVRFIYVHPKDWYLSILEKDDVIEFPVMDNIDINGWDIRKALRLLQKSNSPLLEWLSSPIVYWRDEISMSSFSELAKRAFLPETSCHHYLSMARNSLSKCDNGERISIKVYLYALRAALCCQWIIRQLTQPPMRIQELLIESCPESQVHRYITNLIGLKSKATEKIEIDRSQAFEEYLVTVINYAKENIPRNSNKLHGEEFDLVLREILSRF